MKKLILTFTSIVITSFFLIACGSDSESNLAPSHPYPHCEGLSGYDYESCIEHYYPGSISHSGNFRWDTGVITVESSAQERLSNYIESLDPYICNSLFDNASYLGGCSRMGERTRIQLFTNSLSVNQSVTVSIIPHFRSDVVSNRSFTATGFLKPSGNKLRVDAQPFMIIIEQDKLYEGNMRASIYIDGALIASTNLSYYSSYYDNNNYNCVSGGGSTYCPF